MCECIKCKLFNLMANFKLSDVYVNIKIGISPTRNRKTL